jgi:hypothetical protein
MELIISSFTKLGKKLSGSELFHQLFVQVDRMDLTFENCSILKDMFREIPSPKLLQPLLLILDDSTGQFEIFPAVWVAIENLVLPDAEIRHKALDRLLQLNAPRFSPIVAYILATRLTDPDIKFRARIVRTLSEILMPDDEGNPAPENVRNCLTLILSQSRTRQIFALLQVIVDNSSLESQAAHLINACPYGGTHLVDIMNNPKAPIEVRKQAVGMIGRVGFLDTLSSLERLESKLENRLNGQKTMPFAPTGGWDEVDLLPSIRTALNCLRTIDISLSN